MLLIGVPSLAQLMPNRVRLCLVPVRTSVVWVRRPRALTISNRCRSVSNLVRVWVSTVRVAPNAVPVCRVSLIDIVPSFMSPPQCVLLLCECEALVFVVLTLVCVRLTIVRRNRLAVLRPVSSVLLVVIVFLVPVRPV